jgi:cytoskeletal protein RodZ
VKLTRGTGLGRFILSPIFAVAVLALLTTAVVFAAPPAKTHPTVDAPSASAGVDKDTETPEAEDSQGAEGSQEPAASLNPGACNALNGNAPQVIAELVANWPIKHDKGDKTKDVPAGLQKVADRLLACQSAAPEPGASPSVTGDKSDKTKTGKKTGKSKDH